MRKLILFWISMLFIAAGFSTLTLPYPPEIVAMDPGISAHLRLFSPDQIGWLFTAAGALGVGCAFRNRCHAFGFAMLQFLSVFWTTLYVLSWVDTGHWRAVWPALQYLVLVGILWASSKVVEAPRKVEVE